MAVPRQTCTRHSISGSSGIGSKTGGGAAAVTGCRVCQHQRPNDRVGNALVGGTAPDSADHAGVELVDMESRLLC